MLCFVTVGTTKFDELIEMILSDDCIQQLSDVGVNRLRIQYGNGRMPHPHEESNGAVRTFTLRDIAVECYRFKSSLMEDMATADIIIGHAGAGTCLEVIQLKKPFIVVINELLMDNHQSELAEQLSEMGCLLYTVCNDLPKTLKNPNLFQLKDYPSGHPKQIMNLIKHRLGFL